MVRKKAGKGGETDPISDRLMNAFDDVMRSNKEILAAAMDDVLGENANDRPWLRANASNIVRNFEDVAHQAYRRSEAEAQAHALRTVFASIVPPGGGSAALLDALAASGPSLDRFYMRIAQGRKSRAGSALEVCLASLFTHLGYPYTPHAVINGKPDFIFPSVGHFRRLATDCIVFTSKRTLRERWRQIISEGAKGANFFLATLDEGVRAPDLQEMNENRIKLVVPESIRLENYAETPNVISFESFIVDHAETAMARWRRNGVIGQEEFGI